MKKIKEAKKKYKIKYKNVFILLTIVAIITFIIICFFNIKISNIFILNNSYLSDIEIIEEAGIKNYPSTLLNSANKIKNKLEKSIYIKSAKVYKKNLTEVYIEIQENIPLFYDSINFKTIMQDQTEVNMKLTAPTVLTTIPTSIYEVFVEKMSELSVDIINRISEIEYVANEVDDKRFLFTMNDGNYVYLTLYKLTSINNYMEIIKNFNGAKGTLFLDSGEYFKIAK